MANQKQLQAPFTWTCPFCNSTTTINRDDFSSERHELTINTKYGTKFLFTHFIVCPNPGCKEFSLILQIFKREYVSQIGGVVRELEKNITVIPAFTARMFPEYVPQPIRDDYYEACQIRELSPKASATLSRRCLQGMIRDFWGITKSRLIDEIKELEGMVDPLTWNAIDSVRKLGNIGAHMEKDVNIVIDVEPTEASLLLGLVETLIRDWYITRYERQKQLNLIIEMSTEKEKKKKEPNA